MHAYSHRVLRKEPEKLSLEYSLLIIYSKTEKHSIAESPLPSKNCLFDRAPIQLCPSR